MGEGWLFESSLHLGRRPDHHNLSTSPRSICQRNVKILTRMVVRKNPIHLVLADRICCSSVVISSDDSLPPYLGMRPLPLLTILSSSSSEVERVLSEISDGPPKCRPSAVLP